VSLVGDYPTCFALADLVFYSWFDHPRRLRIIPVFWTLSRIARRMDRQSG
jgi:hypothetical protein